MWRIQWSKYSCASTISTIQTVCSDMLIYVEKIIESIRPIIFSVASFVYYGFDAPLFHVLSINTLSLQLPFRLAD